MGRVKGLAVLLFLLSGCNEHQSTLAPFGAEVRDIRSMFVVLVTGALVILLFVAALYVRAVRAQEGRLSHEAGMRMVLWVGAIGPALVLTLLLLYALPAMRPRGASATDLVIAVRGEQFWWRVAYHGNGDGQPLVSANEVRIPVGRTVAFELTASDVIHSFWVPGLAGKMDMIPGRTTRLVVKAEKAGRYRGVCAEFCGLSHALMAFDVVAMESAAFDAWHERSRKPAEIAEREGRGAQAFDRHGCGACHAIRGTPHRGVIGPDLSRFGERASLGAGTLAPTRDAIAAFIRTPQDSKPGARMPDFAQLSTADALAIADYLKALR
ncbi:cytochrome c oxidase subunit II [Sphingobium phenoxybenzoativorans]|uniref:Cytochrome aa3 subunit 2 n=1 Tax=Sphingobium phenoxybenzoativorans TaxID=1592790 RepID=A0A975Q109_9SPHN|nr:cytochrome c oxidase subunit II [Sphingobium phenoxybenzoativorans]QUT05171.1 cytochrome c oxidase subunit II [Sphingobium phenoxybenzoativorans]